MNILRNASNAVAYTGSNTVISRQGMVDMEWEILVLLLKSSVDITTRPVLGLVIFQIAAIAASIVA